ncbi:MAG: Coenzyme F420 hydrogenase/dehydrogenase, beta subunit C-terminal domain [Desulfobacterales bacterium]|nr:Coenzyme F420 hydrogenase/dehydrogenase, beta subunit C-terminal domain [Desulfobacterales bacterium]MBS3756115.1 Coenzyme F420 hydrogenase/dehydrogenase, beta subunit C-terminal domain [Desulfobacterales bacterium]
MSRTADINIKDNHIGETIGQFLKKILESDEVAAVLTPHRPAEKDMIMPRFITDPEHLQGAEPLSPAFAVNSARLVSRLTRQSPGGTIAALLRPCEIRAFVELVKLNQGSTENLIIIGTDCPGALQNADFFAFAEKHGDKATARFLETAFSDDQASAEDLQIAPACRACTQPTPEGADLAIGLFGLQPGPKIQVYAQTERGEVLLEKLGLEEAQADEKHQSAAEDLISRRSQARQEMIEQTRAATDTMEKLADYFSRCINCYNCRTACPVCYCRECVFATDVFDHEPVQYMKWAGRRGSVKMPTDTLFFHLTRMAHISTACVGCGQCANVCPSNIPLAELFISVAEQTQSAFSYQAGKSIDEQPPLAVFQEDEFQEIVGIENGS